MRLVFLLLADYANITLDSKLNVAGIFNTINATNYPARHPTMFVVMKFSPELGETSQTSKLTIKLEDLDAKAISTLSVPLEMQKFSSEQTNDSGFILQWNDLVFPKPGNYEFAVYVDDEFVGRTPLNANLISPDKSR